MDSLEKKLLSYKFIEVAPKEEQQKGAMDIEFDKDKKKDDKANNLHLEKYYNSILKCYVVDNFDMKEGTGNYKHHYTG